MFNPWVGKIPQSRKWQPTPVFLLGDSLGQRSLAGYCPWGHKESDMTKYEHKDELFHQKNRGQQQNSVKQLSFNKKNKLKKSIKKKKTEGSRAVCLNLDCTL